METPRRPYETASQVELSEVSTTPSPGSRMPGAPVYTGSSSAGAGFERSMTRWLKPLPPLTLGLPAPLNGMMARDVVQMNTSRRPAKPPSATPQPFVAVLVTAVSYTHLRAHETPEHLVCRLLLEKK